MTGYSTAWSAEDQQKAREAVAAGMSATDIGVLIGRTKKAIHCGVKRYGLGTWPCLDDREMPEGFAEDAPVLGLQDIMKKYKCGDKNARKWRADLGIVAVQRKRKPVKLRVVKTRPAKPPRPRKEPKETFTRQASERPKSIPKPGYMTAPVDRGYKEDSAAGEAQRFLQDKGYIPVVRCNAERVATPGGKFWICGLVKGALTDAQLVARATEIGERDQRLYGRRAA